VSEDLLTQLHRQGRRCERVPEIMATTKLWDVADGDNDKTKRHKWNQLAMTIWHACATYPDGPSYACERCTDSFNRAFNRPEGPWAYHGDGSDEWADAQRRRR
jgi:hypothetical protein